MIQAAVQVQAPPAPPAPPAIAGGSGGNAATQTVVTSTGVVLTMPTTSAGISALKAQRSELSNQLLSAAGRREDLAKELANAPAGSRPGIQSRMDLLDQRILQLESDISTSGQLLTSAQGTIETSNNPFSGNSNMDFTAVSVVFTIFVLFPLAITYARSMWRRGTVPKGEAQLQKENAERLGRLETAVDAIAIEMERVSEGQRFVTKLLSESKDRVRVEAPRS